MKKISEILEEKIGVEKLSVSCHLKGELLSLSNERFYVLKSGQISVEINNKSFNEFKVVDLYRGELIAPLLTHKNLTELPVSIIVRKPSEILSVSKKDFFDYIRENPEDLQLFFNYISEKTSKLFQKLLFFTMTIEDKFLYYLDKNKDENNIVVLDKSMTELAKEFFITRPSLYKIVNQLVENKIIVKLDGKTYKIL